VSGDRVKTSGKLARVDTARDYIIRTRLTRAATMLQNTDSTLVPPGAYRGQAVSVDREVVVSEDRRI